MVTLNSRYSIYFHTAFLKLVGGSRTIFHSPSKVVLGGTPFSIQQLKDIQGSHKIYLEISCRSFSFSPPSHYSSHNIFQDSLAQLCTALQISRALSDYFRDIHVPISSSFFRFPCIYLPKPNPCHLNKRFRAYVQFKPSHQESGPIP